MKNKLLILAMGFALTTQMIMAQVPSYVPLMKLSIKNLRIRKAASRYLQA